MKYLKLHYIVWFILVFAFTTVDALLWSIVYLLYVLWNFKLPKKFWSSYHQSSVLDELGGLIYEDENVIETLKRRFKGDI